MLVKETISFKKRKDPKKALGLKLEPQITYDEGDRVISFSLESKGYIIMDLDGNNRWNLWYVYDDNNEEITEFSATSREEAIEKAKNLIINHFLSIKETMQFQKKRDPKSTLGLGSGRRVFKDTEDAAQWAFRYPAEYTEGEITEWTAEDIEDFAQWAYFYPAEYTDGKITKWTAKHIEEFEYIKNNTKGLNYLRLEIIKWIKDNISWEYHPEWGIGLKEAKDMYDRLIEIVKEKTKTNEAVQFQKHKDPKGALDLDPFLEIVEKIKYRLESNVGPMESEEDFDYNPKTKIITIRLSQWLWIGINGILTTLHDMEFGSLKGFIEVEELSDKVKIKLLNRKLKEYGETNIPSVNQDENTYKKIHGQQYIMDSTEKTEDDEEEVDEALSFQKIKDPKTALGLGRLSLIEDWLEEMDLTPDCTINDDLTIDGEHIILENKGLVRLPEYIQFNKVKDFYIGYNELETLRGCPEYVSFDFGCSNNELTSLEFCPKFVGARFMCSHNPKRFSHKEVLNLCNVKKDYIIT